MKDEVNWGLQYYKLCDLEAENSDPDKDDNK